MTRLVLYAVIAASIGGRVVYVAAGNLPEGAIAGALLGACFGLMVATRKGAGDAAASYEYEAAGIHDSNLTTIARRNLARGAYRDSVRPRIIEEKIEGLGRADRLKHK